MRTQMKRRGIIVATVVAALTVSLSAISPAQADNWNGQCNNPHPDEVCHQW